MYNNNNGNKKATDYEIVQPAYRQASCSIVICGCRLVLLFIGIAKLGFY